MVGLMSGTSADGIDAVVAAIGLGRDGLRASLVTHTHDVFPQPLRNRILRAGIHGNVAEICELNFLLGELFARAAQGVIRKANLKPKNIFAIGSHGQTVHHLPDGKPPSTLQIGEPAVIAERTGITTVADFRVRDMAAGGQGAPLVPFADWALLKDPTHPRVIQNIGGIANLTFLPAKARLEEVIAFDTGPGNMLIDATVFALSRGRLSYDRNGRWAARGRVSEKLVSEWMSHPFFRKTPPKTTGREQFGEVFFREIFVQAKRARLKPEDMAATVTAFTAATVADAYRRFVFPRLSSRQTKLLQIVLGGGGAKNPVLRRMIMERLKTPADFLTHADFGIDNSAKEPLAFAMMAYETLHGRPGNVPGATGAKRRVVLGNIVPADAAGRLLA